MVLTLRRNLLIALAIATLGIATFFWWQTRVIKIGFVGELSTSASELSVESREAFLYVVDTYNQKGGLLGRKIEPAIFDDTNDNAYKNGLLKALEAEEIQLIVGFNVSSMVPTIEYLLENGDFLVVSPTVTTDEMTGKDDRFIKISPPNERQIDPLFSAVKDNQMERMLIVYSQSNLQYTKGLVSTMAQKMKEDGRAVVDQIGVESQIDFDQINESILKHRADSVFIVLNGSDTAQVIQHTRISGYKGHFLTGTWAATTDLLANAGQYGNGLYTCEIKAEHPDMENYNLLSAYIKEHTGSPLNFAHTRGYNATKMLFDAILKAKSTEPEVVKRAMLQIGEYQGIETKFTLDDYGDTLGVYQLIQIQNGKFVKVD